MAGRQRTTRGQSRLMRSAAQAKKDLLPEFVVADDPELGVHFVSRPPSLLEKLVSRATGVPLPVPVKKRGRGRPKKVNPASGSELPGSGSTVNAGPSTNEE